MADPIVPFDLLRTRTVAIASIALFLATAALFAINVFVPLFLQTTTGATPTQAGLLLVPMMLGITISTNLAGRSIARTGRYKRFPVAGLALMTVALVLLAVVTAHPSRWTVGIGLAVFGLGFGMVGQVLIVAVQNGVDRRQLGVAMATTSFARGLGGAVGAALLGAVFAARVGTSGAAAAAGGLGRLAPAARDDVIHAVQTVFIVAARGTPGRAPGVTLRASISSPQWWQVRRGSAISPQALWRRTIGGPFGSGEVRVAPAHERHDGGNRSRPASVSRYSWRSGSLA